MKRLAAAVAGRRRDRVRSPAAAQAATTPYGKREDVQAFIRQMVQQHAFVERELAFLFARARREPAILAAIAPPKTAPMRSWQTYRARFVTRRASPRAWSSGAATPQRWRAPNTSSACRRRSSSRSSAWKPCMAARWAAGA
jgi:membrane-bound lytic murein transglycosylase B